ncbi:glycosyltransferase family 4 protein [Bacillaceae bacterium Marseille-Q3522]|nr:glycosyltransferase family 4 protein [Bacillaceae bacterium Marseille-Q3522]
MIELNMFSSAEKVKGQGVASAYRELVNVIDTQLRGKVNMTINKWRKADITHYHTVDFQFFLSTFFSKNRGLKIGYVHFLPETLEDSLKLPKPIRLLFNHYLIYFYKRMDELIVVNPSFIPKLAAYGLKEEHIHYMPNFVSKKTFFPIRSDEEKRLLREKNQLLPDQFIVIGVGQVQYRKGVLDFIETARRLPNVRFIWVGGFSFGKITAGYDELKKIYEHPPENVRFTGIVEREKVNMYYQMADMLFLPSFNELFPMTILEAMNCEIPLLLRDLDLYNSILEGYYLKAADIPAFVSIIEQMQEDRNAYRQAKQRAISGAAYYSEDKLANLWYEMYHRLLKESSMHVKTHKTNAD